MIMHKFLFKKNTQKGIAALPVMMLLGAMALAVAIGVTSVAFSDMVISQSSSQSAKALAYADAGARDALWKIAHNKNFSCATTDCYTIDFSTNGCSSYTDCVKVSVSNAMGDIVNPKVITSKGISGTNSRTLQVSVVLDNGTNDPALQYGQITSTIWSELIN